MNDIMKASQSNTYSNGAVLPFELLSLIFKMSLTGAQRALTWGPYHQAISCSQVCVFWRNVALSTPALWRHLFLEYGNLETFAARSNPLTILIDFTRSHRSSCGLRHVMDREMSWLGTYAHRVEHLIINGSSSLTRKITSSLGSDMPSLLALTLGAFGTHDGHNIFVNMQASNLRRLHLVNVEFDLGSLKNLTYIHLECLELDLDKVISLLRRCPHLQDFAIQGVRGYLWAVGAGAEGRVVLDRLEKLTIYDIGTPAFIHLLGHISIPSSAPMLGQLHHDENVTTADDGISQIGISIRGYTVHFRRVGANNYVKIIDDLVLRDISSIFHLIEAAVDMSPITSLTLDVQTFVLPPSIDLWHHVLSAMSSISKIRIIVNDDWMMNFVHTFGMTPCPTLRHLSLCRHQDEDALHHDLDDSRIATFVLKQVEYRRRLGAPSLEVLEINFGDNPIIEKLKGMVCSVVRLQQ